MIYIIKQWERGSINGPVSHVERHRLPYQIIDAWQCPQYPDLKQGDAIISLGGPPSVVNMHDPDYEHEFLIYEAGFLGYAILSGVPFFGICLSHQLRAKMENDPVDTRTYEFGLQKITLNDEGRKHWLYEGIPSSFWVYQHHRDHVLNVDSGATLLGSSAHCAVETVAWDDVGVSTQFHPEVLEPDIEGAIAKYPNPLAATGMTLQEMMAQLPTNYTEYATRLFDNFFKRAGVI